MRKMVLLAVMMALAAMMLAAAPASAQEIIFCDNDDDDSDGNVECEDIVVFFPFFNDFDEFCDFDDDDEDFRCDDEDDFLGFGDFSGVGDFEQEAESGDIDQTFEVSGPGDNSNQTVGIQGVANTGNVQNAIGVGDDLDGDGLFDDGFCDFDDDDRDGNEECEDVVVILDDGFDEFCDNDDDDRDGREECEDIIVFFPFDDGFDFDGDIDFDGNDDVDIEFEDFGADITLSPTQTIDSSQQVNQAAAASAFDVVVVDP
jgi:hypothetical protein